MNKAHSFVKSLPTLIHRLQNLQRAPFLAICASAPLLIVIYVQLDPSRNYSQVPHDAASHAFAHARMVTHVVVL